MEVTLPCLSTLLTWQLSVVSFFSSRSIVRRHDRSPANFFTEGRLTPSKLDRAYTRPLPIVDHYQLQSCITLYTEPTQHQLSSRYISSIPPNVYIFYQVLQLFHTSFIIKNLIKTIYGSMFDRREIHKCNKQTRHIYMNVGILQ